MQDRPFPLGLQISILRPVSAPPHPQREGCLKWMPLWRLPLPPPLPFDAHHLAELDRQFRTLDRRRQQHHQRRPGPGDRLRSRGNLSQSLQSKHDDSIFGRQARPGASRDLRHPKHSRREPRRQGAGRRHILGRMERVGRSWGAPFVGGLSGAPADRRGVMVPKTRSGKVIRCGT